MMIWMLQTAIIASTTSHEVRMHQRGKQWFMVYCSSCHTLRYAGHPLINTPPEEVIRWFGKIPPDLSNVARVRGSAWLTHFLMDFYIDSSRPFGSNNLQLPNAAMPNVLASIAEKACHQQIVREIVTYLEDVADPAKAIRQKIGLIVVSFLAILIGCWLIYFGLIFAKNHKL